MALELHGGYISVKDRLLLYMYSFAEMLREKQLLFGEAGGEYKHMGGMVADIVHKGKMIDFASIFLDGMRYETEIPTPYHATMALLKDDAPLHCYSLLYSKTQHRVRDSLSWQDIRCHHDTRQDVSKMLLTVGLATTFVGYECVLQLGITSHGHIQLALASGIKAALTVDHADFMPRNGRLLAGEFPSSILVQYLPPRNVMGRIETAYTWGGRMRESHTQML